MCVRSSIIYACVVLTAATAVSQGTEIPIDSSSVSSAAGHLQWPRSRCGPFCLEACARWIGEHSFADAISDRFPRDQEVSLRELKQCLDSEGIPNVAVKWTDKITATERAPAIIPIVNQRGTRHFVAVLRAHGKSMLVLDFPGQPVWISTDVLRTQLSWSGEALHVARNEADLPSPANVVPRIVWVLLILAFAAWGVIDWRLSRSGSDDDRQKTRIRLQLP